MPIEVVFQLFQVNHFQQCMEVQLHLEGYLIKLCGGVPVKLILKALGVIILYKIVLK